LVLLGTDPGGEQWLLFGDPTWRDYDYSFEYMAVDFPMAFSMLFRSPDDRHIQNFGYGWIDFKRNVMEYRDGNDFHKRVLRDGKPVYQEMPAGIQKNVWYRGKVRVRGPRTDAYCDDELVLSIDNNPYDSGRVGVRTWRTWPGKNRFRNFLVTAPDGKVLWQGLPELPK
jgi:eukaryotic-like serine/threonine-protein kinase